jgi:hypothetical protein
MKETIMQESAHPSEVKQKVSLLRKYDIPVEHLDFRYLEICKDSREIEKILRILKSGEEGHYPDLIAFTEEKLQTLNPLSRDLREELPALKSQYLERDMKEEILNDLSVRFYSALLI